MKYRKPIKITKENWEKEFRNRFDHFPDSYYNFVVGKDDSDWDNTASDLDNIFNFIKEVVSS